jgi:hypothetical protein
MEECTRRQTGPAFGKLNLIVTKKRRRREPAMAFFLLFNRVFLRFR